MSLAFLGVAPLWAQLRGQPTIGKRLCSKTLNSEVFFRPLPSDLCVGWGKHSKFSLFSRLPWLWLFPGVSQITYFADRREIRRELLWPLLALSFPGSLCHSFWLIGHSPNQNCDLRLAELWVFPHGVPCQVCSCYCRCHWARLLPSAPSQVRFLWQPHPGKAIILASWAEGRRGGDVLTRSSSSFLWINTSRFLFCLCSLARALRGLF